MAITQIQLKRSQTTAIPSSLLEGEPAWTGNGGILYIGSNGQIVPIAGARVPGVLTPNQAIVTDSANFIDKLFLGNTTVNAIVNATSVTLANSTVSLSITKPSAAEQSGNYYLKADGSWAMAEGGAADPGGANTNIQFNDSGSMNGTDGFVFDKSQNTVTVSNTLIVTSSNAVLGASGLRFGNSTVNGVVNSTAFQIQAPSGKYAFTSLNDGFVYAGSSSANVVVNATIINMRATTSAANLTPTTLKIGNSTSNININSTSYGVGANVLMTTTELFIGNSTVNSVINSSSISSTGTLYVQDAEIAGNLTISGTLTAVDTDNMSVNDSIISLARNNGSDILDIGFYGQYNDGTERFTGLVYKAGTNEYELFANTVTEPTTTVNPAATGYARAILKSFLNTGALVANQTAVNITANSTVQVGITANTLSLTTALPGSSGGTGLNTYTAEDILVANSTNGFRKLALSATDGAILMSNGTALIYSNIIDAGTF